MRHGSDCGQRYGIVSRPENFEMGVSLVGLVNFFARPTKSKVLDSVELRQGSSRTVRFLIIIFDETRRHHSPLVRVGVSVISLPIASSRAAPARRSSNLRAPPPRGMESLSTALARRPSLHRPLVGPQQAEHLSRRRGWHPSIASPAVKWFPCVQFSIRIVCLRVNVTCQLFVEGLQILVGNCFPTPGDQRNRPIKAEA